MTAPAPPQSVAYGADPAQTATLHRPAGASLGTVVVIHGGFWRARYDASLGLPLARDLAARGYTAWNLEYRRVGNGGGWPNTFLDVAAGIDRLAGLDVDTTAVITVGHSAGGQLAVWAAARPALAAGDPGAAPLVTVTGAVAQAGVLDLRTAYETGVGHGAVLDLLGATPIGDDHRWQVADPMTYVPPTVPVVCVHAPEDDTVPIAQSRRYVSASGGKARLIEAAGDHYTLIDPRSPDWQLVLDELPALSR